MSHPPVNHHPLLNPRPNKGKQMMVCSSCLVHRLHELLLCGYFLACSTYRLCPNSGDASFEGCIRRAIASLRCVKGCPISKAPSNAADKCSLLFPDLKDTTDVSFTAKVSQDSLHVGFFAATAVAVAANYIFNDKSTVVTKIISVCLLV